MLNEVAPDIQQLPVAHTRGARGLAITAGKTAIQVRHRGGTGLAGFQHVLDQVNPTPRTVPFIPGVEVSGAGGETNAAMNTGAREFARGDALRCVAMPWVKFYVHYDPLHPAVETARIECALGVKDLL